MKRLLIRKLIVISDGEEKSKEVSFSQGLNIIIGENKTGKSSLIKSIFHSLGCEVKLEGDWKKLIDSYLLFFIYGDNEYCVVRQGKQFRLIEILDDSMKLLVDTLHFHEYSNYLMREIFGISIDLLTKDEDTVSITPPLLFRFQYIDQDRGWNKIGESFTNTQYIINWKDYTNKYIVGFQGEEFYKTKKEINQLNKKIDQLKSKLNHYNELIEEFEVLNSSVEGTYTPPQTDLELVKRLLKNLTQLEKERLRIHNSLSNLKNERYEKTQSLEILKRNIHSLNDDHQFAMEQDDIILCPFCGKEHKNSLEERVEIIKDIQVGNQLIKLNRDDLKKIEGKVSDLEKEYHAVNSKYVELKKNLESTQSGASVVNTYRYEGKKELIHKSKEESRKVRRKLEEEHYKFLNKDEYLKELNSEEKRKQVYSELKRHYKIVMNKLNIPLSYMKFRDFVQVLNKTGSELPRIIYAYHIALYLFNLEKGKNIFNWLVVDTPNQQGQDETNLKNIDLVLDLVLSEKGQFIIGTERKTGFENKANQVIKLTEYKRCLSNEKYLEHKELLSKFDDL
ncbi:hypothetical protein [Bacillus sp. SD088]|uniref:hypothetical protein n=1 Tax=Bacillus sp. SD088 TaxID=2782012 RepID=UPI001A975E6A|nr:hypothetical protein [Bacillus sp. SD088]MBO0995682.1 hypothetical protein [Bacillus sp. SD088]